MSNFVPFRVGVSAVALFSLLLVGCSTAGTGGDSSSELEIPQVESTDQNIQACYEFAQPKGFVEPGSAMSTTVSFYTELSNASTGALSRGFALAALRAAELAPYYEADVYPPEQIMTNFQAATYVLDSLCGKVLKSGASSSESTATPTNESGSSGNTNDTTTTTISATEQIAIDEQLFQEMLYKGQQKLENARDTPEDFATWWQIGVENSYPPYREFITDGILNRCLARDLDTYSNFTVDYMTLKIGSSVPTPDWEFKVTPPSGQAIKSFKPSDFGRTYVARVSLTRLGFKPERKDVDLHYVIIDGKAFYFPYFDFCLDLRG